MRIIFIFLEIFGVGKWEYYTHDFQVTGKFPYIMNRFCRKNKWTNNTFYRKIGIQAMQDSFVWRKYDKNTKFYN